jgi:enoyl-CoA hydratase/carnithine racemase
MVAHTPAEAIMDGTSAADEVLYTVEGHIAVITLNRPERMNTISVPMLDALARLLLQADADPQVRVVILTGNGRMFCAGLDLEAATRGAGIGSSDHAASASTNLDLKTAPPTVLFHMDKPVICALNGAAAGYGMDTALGCDIRIMARSAKLAAAFVKRGVVPESGGTWHLPRMLGWELPAAARRMAEEIAANAPLAVQASKRLMRMGLSEGFNDHVHHVYLQFLSLIRTEDAREGMVSFLEKRPAAFTGR